MFLVRVCDVLVLAAGRFAGDLLLWFSACCPVAVAVAFDGCALLGTKSLSQVLCDRRLLHPKSRTRNPAFVLEWSPASEHFVFVFTPLGCLRGGFLFGSVKGCKARGRLVASLGRSGFGYIGSLDVVPFICIKM